MLETQLVLTAGRSVWDYYDPDMKLIGRGAFARVFKSKCLATKQDIAIKVIGRDARAFQQQRRGRGQSTGGMAGTWSCIAAAN